MLKLNVYFEAEPPKSFVLILLFKVIFLIVGYAVF